MFPLIVAVLTALILLGFLPPRQEFRHWIKSVGIHVSVDEFGVNDDVILSLP